MSEDIDHMEGCRTCGVFSPLQYNFLRNIFSSDTDFDMENVRNMLRTLNIQIDEQDGLPQYICTQCILHVQKICEFQRNLQEVQEQLRQWYFVDKIKMKIKEEAPEDLEMLSNTNDEHVEKDCIFLCMEDLVDYECTPKMIVKTESPSDELSNNENTSKKTSDIEKGTREIALNDRVLEKNNYWPTAIKSTENSIINSNVEIETDELNTKTSQSSISKNKNFFCYICNKNFAKFTNQRFKNHVAWHRLEKRKKFKCSCCGFICLSQTQLKEHRNIVHASKTCSICYKLISANQFKVHMLKHRAAGLSICKICQKEFVSDTERDDHIIQIHSSVDVTMREHEETFQNHTNNEKDESKNENSYGDQDVEIVFEPIETVHISDTEDKQTFQFECHICGKTFGLQFGLNRHLKRH